MKKVAFILPKCFPYNKNVNSGIIGGSQSRAILLLREFLKQGYNPTVFSLNYGNNSQYTEFEGCRLFQSGNPTTELGMQDGYKRIFKVISEGNFSDVYFFLTKSAGLSYQFELIKKLSSKLNIYVLLLRSDYISEFTSNEIGILSNTKYIVAQQEVEKRKLLERGIESSKIITIPNPVDLNRFTPIGNEQKKFLRKAMNISNDTFILLSTSRFVKGKGVEYFLEVLESFSKEEKVKGLVVGFSENENEWDMTKKIKDKGLNPNVYFAGKILYEEMPYWYQISDAFVSNSCAEGFSNSLLEACASGLPVIATDIEENQILIRNNYNGFLYKYGDIKSLRDNILSLKENIILRNQFGAISRDMLINKFDSEYITKKFIQLLQ